MQYTLKGGGSYEDYTGKVRKIDSIDRTLVFLAKNGRSSGKTIPVDDISELRGNLVDYMDDFFADGYTGLLYQANL